MVIITQIYETIKEVPGTLKYYLRQGKIALLPEERKPYHKLPAKELKQMLTQKQNFLLLDVRTKMEYDTERIPTSVHIEAEEAPKKIKSLASSFSDKIVLYCHGGERSTETAAKLHQLGYRNIYYLAGGISKWNYETEKNPSA